MQEFKFTKEFREAIIALLLQDEGFLKEAAPVLKPDHFEEIIHAAVVTIILASYQKNLKAPSKTMLLSDLVNELLNTNKVKDKDAERKIVLKPAEDFIEKLYRPINGRVDDIKHKYLEFARNQEMKNTLLQMYQDLETGKVDHNSIFSDMRRTYNKINDGIDGIGKDFFETFDNFPASMKGMRDRVFTTGFDKLDLAMDGGLSAGTLTVFMAPPKGGKSMILVNVGVANLYRSKTVVIFTLEISERRLQQRYLSRITRVPMSEMSLRMDDVMEKCAHFHNNFKGRLFIKEYPTGGASVDTMRGYLYRLQSQKNVMPDMIIIDYGDIVKSSGRWNEERFEQKASYEEMRALAKEFNCPVVTASQCNRKAVNKQIIKLDDIAESFAKCAIADHIISVSQTEAEVLEKRVRLHLAGSREAQAGITVKVRTDWSTCTMQECDSKEEVIGLPSEKWKNSDGSDF